MTKRASVPTCEIPPRCARRDDNSPGDRLGVPSTVLATFLTVQVIGPEISSGSLQLVMARPIGRVPYLLSRFAGVCLVAMLLVWVVVLATLLFGTVIGQEIAIVDQLLHEVAASLKMIFFMALIVLFGCMSRSHASVLLRSS